MRYKLLRKIENCPVTPRRRVNRPVDSYSDALTSESDVRWGLDGPGVLSCQQFTGRQPRPGWRTCRGCLRRMCLPGPWQGGNGWPRSGVSRPRHRPRSVRLCGGAELAGLPSWELAVLWPGEGWWFKFAWRVGRPGQRCVRGSAVPAARSSDRHLTVGLAVTGELWMVRRGSA
jgi:hypothetical protein